MNWLQIYERVSAWNAARYERKFDLPLTVALLREEFNETRDAVTDVDKLDGRLDQIYVALGGIWKLNISDDLTAEACGFTAVSIEKAILSGFSTFDAGVSLTIDALVNPDMPNSDLQRAVFLFSVVWYNVAALEWAGFDAETTLQAMSIVCDSNDSKTVERVASDVKANTNKGDNFIAPEPELQKIVNLVKLRNFGVGHAKVQ